MGRKKVSEELALKYEVKTRVNEKKFQELQDILSINPTTDMSTLVRSILDNRRVKVFTYDKSLDMVMEELSSIRYEIKSIGVNINQITRFFNTYPEPQRKEFYAMIAFKDYLRIETKIELLLSIVSKLSKKWLSE